jgi:hypothetical protein
MVQSIQLRFIHPPAMPSDRVTPLYHEFRATAQSICKRLHERADFGTSRRRSADACKMVALILGRVFVLNELREKQSDTGCRADFRCLFAGIRGERFLFLRFAPFARLPFSCCDNIIVENQRRVACAVRELDCGGYGTGIHRTVAYPILSSEIDS